MRVTGGGARPMLKILGRIVILAALSASAAPGLSAAEADVTAAAPVTLSAPRSVGATSVSLDWSSEPTGTRAGYRVYFRQSGSTTESIQTFGTSSGSVT